MPCAGRQQRSGGAEGLVVRAHLTASRSLPLLSSTTSNDAPPTAAPTSAGSLHTVFPPALVSSCPNKDIHQNSAPKSPAPNAAGVYTEKREKGGFFILSEASSPTVSTVTACPAASSSLAK